MSLVTQTGCNNKPRERRVISAFSCIKDGWKKKNKKKKVLLLLFRGPWIIPLGYSAVVYITFDTRSVAKKERKKKNLTIIMPVRKIYLHLCVFGSRRYYEEVVLIFVLSLFNTFVSVCVGILGWQEERTDFHVSDGWLLLSQRKSQSRSKSMSSRTAAAGQHNLQINHFYFYFISF
jgi:hypothetical protein